MAAAGRPREFENLSVDQALSLVEKLTSKYDPKELDAVVRGSVGEDVYTSWYARVDLESVQDESVRLSVPTRFLKSWIEAHYFECVLSQYWPAEMPEVHRVDPTVRSTIKAASPRAADQQSGGDEGSQAEWEEVKAEVLRLLGAEALDTPTSHLAYIRKRIKPVTENDPVEP